MSRYATRILLHPFVEVEANVWLASYAPLVLGAVRIGEGTVVHQGVTLGAGGPREARGLPIIGRGVVLGPGAIVVGGIDVADGTVVGPSSSLKGEGSKNPASRWAPISVGQDVSLRPTAAITGSSRVGSNPAAPGRATTQGAPSCKGK